MSLFDLFSAKNTPVQNNTPTNNDNMPQEDERTGISVATLKKAIANNLFYALGKFPATATDNDYYMALAYTVRDRMLQRWLASANSYWENKNRMVCYLSAEYLLGPHLANNLLNLGIYEPVKQAVEELGLNLERLIDLEEEPGLGSGGLGRLAACYLESMATLQIPAIGYGIRYEYGIFDQEIRDGWQVEITDLWLRYGNPWEMRRSEVTYEVKFGGYVEHYTDSAGRFCSRWHPHLVVKGVAYDTPILGYRVNNANTLRLWKAEAPESFDFQAFNVGDYYGAVHEKTICENISKVLYPNDEPLQGKQLRLQQQYFFVSCSLQDMLQMHLARGEKIETFHEKFVVQLNDTHPAIAPAELMRLLLDEHFLDWDTAWHITTNTFAYTNHTLMPEALEKWDLELFGSLFPRHLEIIYEINRRHLDQVAIKFLGNLEKIRNLSLIEEGERKALRMASLASVSSFAINGVSAIHSQLLQETVLKDWYQFSPEKFTNITNGVTPRRWLALINPSLSRLITDCLGSDEWLKNLDLLKDLEKHATSSSFQEKWRQVKRENKVNLARYIQQKVGVVVNPDSIFDVMVKRIHEYKRQHLKVLHIITLYNRLKRNPDLDIPPYTFIFGGKAAPGYWMAKLIIKLINSVADVINNDPDVKDRIKVVFIPDYNVTVAQKIIPAADISEQISLAGKEASGTSNMKFAMNGAITVGTLDGANIEIRDCVGEENFFSFGLTVDQVKQLSRRTPYPKKYYISNQALQVAIDQIATGFFSHLDSSLFHDLVDNLLYHDPFFVLADYQPYVDCHEHVALAYKDKVQWTKMSILNTARIGKFSSDRSVKEYAERIWKIQATPVELVDLCPSGECKLVSTPS